MRKIFFGLIFSLYFILPADAAPCYGTRLPEAEKFSLGIATHAIFNRYLEAEEGSLRSQQHFLLVSYGVFDWLAIDLKGGAGNIKQHPLDSDEIDYPSGFSGGYGFRLKLLDKEEIRAVLGFQHISVHPQKVHLEGVKHQAVLDDWQGSLLLSRDFSRITPYVGMTYSRLDYIHWREEDRKRIMSDLTKVWGAVCGLDLSVSENLRFNLEGQFFNTQALAFSVNFDF